MDWSRRSRFIGSISSTIGKFNRGAKFVAQVQPLISRIDEVRTRLKETLAFSPHDFIRRPAEFVKADRAVYIDELTRELDPQDDLRFVYSTDQSELVLFARRLPWDSQFFGYGVARLDGIFPLVSYDPTWNYNDVVAHLLEQAQAHGIKYLFATVAPEDLAALRALGMHRFGLIETRAVYHRPLADYDYPQRYAVRLATRDDIPSLAQTARTMVNAYDRFHADPFIGLADAGRLMEKWIETSINEGFADEVLVPNVPNPKAFCTVKYHRDKWDKWGLKLGQPVFSAVGPEFQGWYIKIISELNYHLRDIGVQHCYLITQITNRAVIRVWEKLGFSYGRGEHVFRIVL
jgi:dTDP-4-amino-4,6-dideoxy-D-galactose acyltransferase